jgi:hypothetical protein
MKLITRFQLASKPTGELHALHRDVFNALVSSDAGTPERRNALASLDNIESELRARLGS